MAFVPTHFGWVNDQAAVWKGMYELERQGKKALFSDAAPHLMVEDDNSPVLFWDAEQKLFGKLFSSWDQSSIGACVSFGWGRGCQDLMLWQVASGTTDQYPNHQVSPEPIYGGSRVQVGGGQIQGDGSIGMWAAKWVSEWGILLREVYNENGHIYDLSSYSVDRAREYGDRGCPKDLEPVAKQHPVTAVAMVRTGAEAWAAIGAGKPVPICSDRGFTAQLVNGFCEPSGTWGHCMTLRGRFNHPTRGRCFVIQNSWSNYLAGTGDNHIEVEGRGLVELPEGCFATTIDVIDYITGQQDSFAVAGLKGWARERIDYTP